MQLDLTFAALSDPTRRAMLARLARGEATVSELAEPHHLGQPTISKHLKVLERAGLVEVHRSAQMRPRRLKPEALMLIDDWLAPYREQWQTRLDRLDAFVSDPQEQTRDEQ